MNDKIDTPKTNIRFVFNHCNDPAAMQVFYSDVVGLKEAAFDEEQGYLVYQCEGFQMMFFRAENELAPPGDWADQPGYEGGTLEGTSWAIEVPEYEFAETVERVLGSGARVLKNAPEWRMDSYWGFTAIDPMGNTIEIYTIPAEKPETTTWPGK
ncbi:MAG: hypothetical protein JSW52_05770 [Candidatus Coatesbacteria bacterium]|nr:MAG: hypothetical protein JSW52_05770 [Candidatus Coatesbacteria bacterium]